MDFSRQLTVPTYHGLLPYAFYHKEFKISFHNYPIAIFKNLTDYYASYLTMLQWGYIYYTLNNYMSLCSALSVKNHQSLNG